MLRPIYNRQFERDVKRQRKRGKNLDKLKIIVKTLLNEKKLDPIHRNHKLIGNWQGRQECHIESDWLLIYKYETDHIIFERTGTHADLFSK